MSWHQDSTYWGLSRPDVVTAWVALSASNRANGAMEVIPGTHVLDQIAHRDTFSPDNLLTRGQEVAVEVERVLELLLLQVDGEVVPERHPFGAEHPGVDAVVHNCIRKISFDGDLLAELGDGGLPRLPAELVGDAGAD